MATFLQGYGGIEGGGQTGRQDGTSLTPHPTKHKRFRADQVIRKKTLGCGTILSQLVKLPPATDSREWIGKSE